MISFLKQMLGGTSAFEKTASCNDVEKIEVAVCALLLEAAHSDDEFTAEERLKIRSVLRKHFELTENEADALIATSDEARKKSVDLWHFTAILNDTYSLDEKIKVAEMLWEIVYADTQLDAHEDYLMHQMGQLLHLDHKHLINAKLKAKR